MSLIFLIGMPGSGKTYYGKQLAKDLGCRFVDTDNLVEEEEQRTISEIFKTSGESHFRTVERRVLQNTISSTDKEMIVACGGGLPAFDNNLDKMKAAGSVVYLQCDIQTLAERVKAQNSRPLLNVDADLEKQLSDIYESRMPYYMGAHYIVEQSDNIIEKIKELTTHV